MNPAHIASLVALAWFGCVVQLTFAHGASPAPSAAGGAEDRSVSQKAPADDQESILAVLRGVEAAFSDADLSRWLSFFHSTYMIMAPEGVIAPSSDNEALTLLRPQMETLRARGYARSELNRATVKVLSAATALASVEWVRRKANNEELERLGGTYAFFKSKDGWKIVMVTVHPSTTVVELK